MKKTSAPSRNPRSFVPDLSTSHEQLLVDGTDESFRHVLFLSRLFVDRLYLFRNAIAKTIELSANQYAILLAVAHSQGNKGGTTVRDVAKYALMASTHVTTQVGVLVQRGLIRKQPNSKDGRSMLLSLTAEGEAAMRKIAPLRVQYNDACFEGISRHMLLSAEKFFAKMVANSEEALSLLGDPDAEQDDFDGEDPEDPTAPRS